MAVDDELGLASRALRIAGAMAGVHLEFARREASEDAGRVIGGVAWIASAILFAGFTLASAHVVAFILLHERRELPWSAAALYVLGADMIVGIFCAAVAWRRLRKPILRETRDLVARTVGALAER